MTPTPPFEEIFMIFPQVDFIRPPPTPTITTIRL